MSTSTFGSMLIAVICCTAAVDEYRLNTRLWMRISKVSQVLVPSPFGDLRVQIFSVFVGMRTGPRQLSVGFFSAAVALRSAQTEQREGEKRGGTR